MKIHLHLVYLNYGITISLLYLLRLDTYRKKPLLAMDQIGYLRNVESQIRLSVSPYLFGKFDRMSLLGMYQLSQ
jgi:hypothetical protein